MEPNTVTISPGTNQSVNTQMIILLRSCLSDNPFGLATIGWWWLLEVFGSNHSPKMAWKVTYHRVAALRLSEWRAETVFAADDDHLVGVWLIAEYVQIRETKQEYSARWRGKASSRSSLFHTQHQHTPSADMIKWCFSSDAFSPPSQIQRRPRTDLISWYIYDCRADIPNENTSYISDPRYRTWSEGSTRIGLISVSLRDKALTVH